MALLAEVTKLITGARRSRGELKQRVAAAERRREDLRCMARPREEVADLVCARIDKIGGTYPALLAQCLHQFIHRPMAEFPEERLDDGSAVLLPVCTVPIHAGHEATTKSIERALFYLLAEQLKSAARKAVMTMPYADVVGPPMAARLKEIAGVESQITDLKAEIKALEDGLAAALEDE